MDDKLVPACLDLDSEELERLEGLSAFVESNFTDSGWQLCLVLKRGNIQARAEFKPFLSPTLPTPPVNAHINVQLLDGVDDAMAMMRWQGRLFQAQFSRSNLSGLIRFRYAEPRLTNMSQPHRRFYDTRH